MLAAGCWPQGTHSAVAPERPIRLAQASSLHLVSAHLPGGPAANRRRMRRHWTPKSRALIPICSGSAARVDSRYRHSRQTSSSPVHLFRSLPVAKQKSWSLRQEKIRASQELFFLSPNFLNMPSPWSGRAVGTQPLLYPLRLPLLQGRSPTAGPANSAMPDWFEQCPLQRHSHSLKQAGQAPEFHGSLRSGPDAPSRLRARSRAANVRRTRSTHPHPDARRRSSKLGAFPSRFVGVGT